MSEKRVVVTGMGVVSPVGNDIQTFWDALCTGKSGIGPVTSFDTAAFPTKIAGEVRDIDFSKVADIKEVKRTDRFILFSLYAADEAMKNSGIDMTTVNADRFGTVIGCGIGGFANFESENSKLVSRGPSRVSPFFIPMMISDMASGRVSMSFGLKGPNYSVVSACASAAHSIGNAYMLIKSGMADLVLAGGTEAGITPLSFAGFCQMKAMSTRNEIPQEASTPFDANRDGFVMGEGAGIIVLESLDHALARKAKIHAELSGYGASGDAYHLSAPDPEGSGACLSMKSALKCANLRPEQIDYLNAHGTSTPMNDKLETLAIKKAFGEAAYSLDISSTKSMTGHMLGASGAVEFIASVLAVRDNIIPPTINYKNPDPECDLKYTPNSALKKQVNYALSNSFGFGGHNASLVVGKYQ